MSEKKEKKSWVCDKVLKYAVRSLWVFFVNFFSFFHTFLFIRIVFFPFGVLLQALYFIRESFQTGNCFNLLHDTKSNKKSIHGTASMPISFCSTNAISLHTHTHKRNATEEIVSTQEYNAPIEIDAKHIVVKYMAEIMCSQCALSMPLLIMHWLLFALRFQRTPCFSMHIFAPQWIVSSAFKYAYSENEATSYNVNGYWEGEKQHACSHTHTHTRIRWARGIGKDSHWTGWKLFKSIYLFFSFSAWCKHYEFFNFPTESVRLVTAFITLAARALSHPFGFLSLHLSLFAPSLALSLHNAFVLRTTVWIWRCVGSHFRHTNHSVSVQHIYCIFSFCSSLSRPHGSTHTFYQM